MTDDELLEKLRANATAIRALEVERDRLFADRLALYTDARGRTPPITQKALAEACGVTDAALIQQVRKARAAQLAQGAQAS